MEQAMSTQVSEVFTRGKWLYRDPNDGHKELSSEGHEFGAIAVKSLLHCSHKEEANFISKRKRAFVSQPLLAPPGSWIVNGSTAMLSKTGQNPVLPGDYIRFTVSAELTPEQCRYMRKKRGNRFAYYLTARSVYGMYAFSANFFELLKAYAVSRKCQDLVLKVGGTRHFKNQVFYVMVVCALTDGRDPLPNLPNLPLAEEEGQEKIFDPGEMLDSHGRVLLVKRGGMKKEEGGERGGERGEKAPEKAREQTTNEESGKGEELQKKEEQEENSEEASSRFMDEAENGVREKEKDGERLGGSGSEETSSIPMEKPESVGEGGGDVTWVVLNELGKDKEQEKDKDYRKLGDNGSEEPSSNSTKEELQSEQGGKEGGEEPMDGSNRDGREVEGKPPEWPYSPEAMPKFLPRNPLEVMDGAPQRYDALELVFHFPSPQFAVPSEKPKQVNHPPGCHPDTAHKQPQH